MINSILIGIIIASSVVIIDQVTKILMMAILYDAPGHNITLINNFLSLKLQFNDGAAFSMQLPHFVLVFLPILATIVFFFMARKASWKKNKLYYLGLYMMIRGTIGNFIDRAYAIDKSAWFPGLEAFKYTVCDFISFHFFPATFNIADSFLCVGVALVLIDIIFLDGKRDKGNAFTSSEE